MKSNPRFKYFLFTENEPVLKESRLWHRLLPLNRQYLKNSAGVSVSHREYFLAATHYLEKNDFEPVLSACSQAGHPTITSGDINEIRIYQVKHGEFYHPSRIEVYTSVTEISFVLNVAISESGKKCIKQESAVLKRLNNNFRQSYLPKVYGEGEEYIRNDLKVSMFLGEWFEGYNEFHISDQPQKVRSIRVWDPEKGNLFLSESQARDLYRQAARILTCYYNVETCEQIFPWHHASGDFVIKLKERKIDVKLISARQYAPLFNYSDNNAASQLDSLLVFFLGLSIRMRIDRLDGTGELVWADDFSVQGIIQGFLEGVALQPKHPSFSGLLEDYFIVYISSYYTKSELYELSTSILDTYRQTAPEIPVIKQYLKQHIELLWHFLDIHS